MPAAFLLGIMYEGLGRMEQASSFYSQAAALSVVTWGRDCEVALCLAIMYRDGHGVQKNQYEANRYFGVAQELGNVEAGQLLEQFEFLGR